MGNIRKLTKKQKDKIIHTLKVTKAQGGGQTLNMLSSYANAWNKNVSRYLQNLKRKGLIAYFDTNKIWYWLDDVDLNKIIK